MKTRDTFALLVAVALTAVVLAGEPATAAPVADDQEASRTRPQKSPSKVQSSSPSSSTQKARPRGSSSARSGSNRGAQNRSDAGRELGRRNPPEHSRRSSDRGGGFYGGRTIYWGPQFGPWGFPWGWGWWGGYGYGPYYEPVPYYSHRARPSMGALDLDLRPEEVRVFLNGQEIGIADNFDGWPRYLWLEEGTYDLVFYHEGFETLARQYTIYPGVVIDVEDRMRRGEATPPEELIAQSTERRDERLRRNEERRAAADEMEPGWKERVRAERAREEVRDQRAEVERERSYDARVEPARLELSVEPQDAAVYLDGRFIGSADEILAGRAGRTGMMVDAGEHELEIVRPGYVSKRRSFTAESGESVELTIELEELE